jgi:hypothetical protein
MDDTFAAARETMSQIFMVPAAWFESPIFIVNLVLPFMTMGYFFYMMISKKLHIFRNTAVNLALGYCLAFASMPLFIVPNPYMSLFVSVFGIVTMLGDRITLFRLLAALGLALAAWTLAAYAAYLISLFAA